MIIIFCKGSFISYVVVGYLSKPPSGSPIRSDMAIFFVGASPGCIISTQVRYVNVGASPGCTFSTQVHYIFSVQERGTQLGS